MFIACVVAFVTGLYTEVCQPVSLAWLALVLIISLVIFPFFLKYEKRRLAALTLLAAFFAAGMFRISLASLNEPSMVINPDVSMYRGTVVESSPTTKVVEINIPPAGDTVRASLRSDETARIGDTISVIGSLRELSLNFKNPGYISWKWLKKREGTFYELRGKIISVRQGDGLIEGIRRRFAAKVDSSKARYAGVIKALTIGDTTGLDPHTKDLFMRTGTSHILSISGSHLGIVTGFFFLIIGYIFRMNPKIAQKGGDRKYAAILTIPFALAFMLVSGSSLPAIRATIMIIIYMLSIFFDRSRHVENGFFLTVMMILVIFPLSLFYPSFQLTCLSVLFIVLMTGNLNRLMAKMHRTLKWSISLMSMTIIVTLGTLPVILYHFQGFNPVSIFYNLVAVPLLCIIATPLSLAGLVIPFGHTLLCLAGDIISVTVLILGKMDWGYVYPTIRPTLPETILYLATAVSLIYIRRKIVRLSFITIILPAFLIMSGIACQQRFQNKNLCVHYIDVGLGDAMLVEAPDGVRLLIDGGGFYGTDFDIGKSIIAPFLLSKRIVTLDYVINTHPHEDHIAGLRHILRYFRVNRFASGYAAVQDERGGVKDMLHQKQIPSLILKEGDQVPLTRGITLNVLHPDNHSFEGEMNESSLVFQLHFGEKIFMFTGDIGQAIEQLLVMSNRPLRSSVLKVPHHGSRHSST
ncbi:MAG: DNA internalization-related competence protein ComEC/Rec2, partial [Syntrophorhabdaceae bacterium]